MSGSPLEFVRVIGIFTSPLSIRERLPSHFYVWAAPLRQPSINSEQNVKDHSVRDDRGLLASFNLCGTKYISGLVLPFD